MNPMAYEPGSVSEGAGAHLGNDAICDLLLHRHSAREGALLLAQDVQRDLVDLHGAELGSYLVGLLGVLMGAIGDHIGPAAASTGGTA